MIVDLLYQSHGPAQYTIVRYNEEVNCDIFACARCKRMPRIGDHGLVVIVSECLAFCLGCAIVRTEGMGKLYDFLTEIRQNCYVCKGRPVPSSPCGCKGCLEKGEV